MALFYSTKLQIRAQALPLLIGNKLTTKRAIRFSSSLDLHAKQSVQLVTRSVCLSTEYNTRRSAVVTH
ncbi:hypothetical protein ACKLNR_005664 [Fusarium oxysporum f. sp. zingiberi]